jgi:PAS domain S-box-containing protein
MEKSMTPTRLEEASARSALAASELRYRRLFESAQDGILILDAATGVVVDVNPFLLDLLDYPFENFAGKAIWELGFFKDIIANQDSFAELQHNKYIRYEDKPLEDSSGGVHEVEFISNVYLVDDRKVIQCNIRDITERKRAEIHKEMSREILLILNESGDLQEALQRVVGVLKTQIKVAAVGLRLQDGEDFPYVAHQGFSEDFMRSEDSLIRRNQEGGICRDSDGTIGLECTCGLVLSGKADLANPLFTPGGSFWTNDSATLLHLPADKDLRWNPRDECIHQGYASMALIPISTTEGIIGLIQLNDHRKGCFSLDSVELLEGVAAHIGAAIMRKQTQDQNERLSRFPSENPNPVLRISVQGRLEYANTAADVLVHAMGIRVDGTINAEWQTHIDAAVAASCPVNVECQEGTRTFDITFAPIFDCHYVNLYAREITQRKQVEDTLRKKELLVDGIINTIPLRVFWKDLNLNYLGCNIAFACDAGFAEPKDIVGKNDCQMVWSDQAEQYRTEDRKTIESGEATINREEPQTTPDGKSITLLTSKIPLRNSVGEIIGILGTYIDITEQRQMELQFRQAQKMESVGRLAGGVAHDFNNMLSIILGQVSLALDRLSSTDEAFECLHEIEEAAKRSANLVQQLMAFARQQDVAPQILNPNQNIASMLSMLRQLVGEDIKFVWCPGASVRSILIDPSQFDQILTNLCVNARDAIENIGTISLETGNVVIDADYCATHVGYMPGSYVFLAVTDDGSGMDEATLEHIFEPFFTTKSTGKGTGLGLATVYGIAKQNGGFICAHSELGSGTIFKIYLPQTKEKKGADRSECSHSNA